MCTLLCALCRTFWPSALRCSSVCLQESLHSPLPSALGERQGVLAGPGFPRPGSTEELAWRSLAQLARRCQQAGGVDTGLLCARRSRWLAGAQSQACRRAWPGRTVKDQFREAAPGGPQKPASGAQAAEAAAVDAAIDWIGLQRSPQGTPGSAGRRKACFSVHVRSGGPAVQRQPLHVELDHYPRCGDGTRRGCGLATRCCGRGAWAAGSVPGEPSAHRRPRALAGYPSASWEAGSTCMILLSLSLHRFLFQLPQPTARLLGQLSPVGNCCLTSL